MQSVSLEIQHLVDYLPSKYSVTDKADGERNFLYITDGKVYLISNNLNIVNSKSFLPFDKLTFQSFNSVAF